MFIYNLRFIYHYKDEDFWLWNKETGEYWQKELLSK